MLLLQKLVEKSGCENENWLKTLFQKLRESQKPQKKLQQLESSPNSVLAGCEDLLRAFS